MNYQQLTRLFIPSSLEVEIINWHNPTDANYLFNVMRKKAGQELLIFNSEDGEYLAEIISINHKQISFKILKKTRNIKAETELKLIFAPIKQHRLTFLLEKATELGVTHLIPIQTKHSVIDKVNLSKWQIYVKEAAEQCRRLSLPHIENLQSLDQLINNWPKEDKIIFCNEREKNLFLPKYLANNHKSINFMIGPEGGFSELEINKLLKLDFIKSCHLGNRILRAETAALTVLSMSQEYLI